MATVSFPHALEVRHYTAAPDYTESWVLKTTRWWIRRPQFSRQRLTVTSMLRGLQVARPEVTRSYQCYVPSAMRVQLAGQHRMVHPHRLHHHPPRVADLPLLLQDRTEHRGLLLSCDGLSKQGTSKGLAAQKIQRH